MGAARCHPETRNAARCGLGITDQTAMSSHRCITEWDLAAKRPCRRPRARACWDPPLSGHSGTVVSSRPTTLSHDHDCETQDLVCGAVLRNDVANSRRVLSLRQ